MLSVVMFISTFSPVSIELYHLSTHVDEIIEGDFHLHSYNGEEMGHTHKILKQIDKSDTTEIPFENSVVSDLTIKHNKIFKPTENTEVKTTSLNNRCFAYQKAISQLFKDIIIPPPNNSLV